jgi:hypothetical protein
MPFYFRRDVVLTKDSHLLSKYDNEFGWWEEHCLAWISHERPFSRHRHNT